MKQTSLELRLLAENTARGRGILGEHGLAYWMDTPSGALLFDSGQGLILENNAAVCDIPWERGRRIVLSHGHYDHSGGLETAWKHMPGVRTLLHPGALEEKFTRGGDGLIRSVGMPQGPRQRLISGGQAWDAISEPMELFPGLWATGPIPRKNDYEDVGGAFFLDEQGTIPDPLEADQALFAMTARGVVIILGCAHAGVVNTMEYVLSLTGEESIHAVIGGMHLLHADRERLEKTFEAFREHRVEVLGACHCTGSMAASVMRQTFQEAFVEAHAGRLFSF